MNSKHFLRRSAGGALAVGLAAHDAACSDGTTDSVNLVGTSSADHVDVFASSTRVRVTGLPIVTTISGSATPDQLQISAEGPDDTIVADPAVDALVTTIINPHV